MSEYQKAVEKRNAGIIWRNAAREATKNGNPWNWFNKY